MQTPPEDPSTSAPVSQRLQTQTQKQFNQRAAQQQATEEVSPAEQRRRALQQFLLKGLVDVENFVLAARHFIIPANSLADKLPFIK